MQRLLDSQRRYDTHSMTSAELSVLEELTPIESQSTRIWNDRGYLKDQAQYDENRLHGTVGSYQFTNQQQKMVEKRFKASVSTQRRPLNAARAKRVFCYQNEESPPIHEQPEPSVTTESLMSSRLQKSQTSLRSCRQHNPESIRQQMLLARKKRSEC